ncbi:heme-binding protein [Burkholderia glumae]|uniref:heme-binding protein n=1 Tax=Burkholderia glumae TaxID=337 RepID=UPI001E5097A8|nr:heme-binding protein [Burkholderia glumae]MCM2550677.1 heme-binding protein [Burkholderia glumae]MCQ0029976.1 heme-binding protein [Burkholderia glumae]MCQ0035562.1 heme-binding protein [Burkholderia glumae]
MRHDRSRALPSAGVAFGKAWTAASHGPSTPTWNAALENPQVAPLACRPRMAAVAGGCPILVDGRVVWAASAFRAAMRSRDRELGELALKQRRFGLR